MPPRAGPMMAPMPGALQAMQARGRSVTSRLPACHPCCLLANAAARMLRALQAPTECSRWRTTAWRRACRCVLSSAASRTGPHTAPASGASQWAAAWLQARCCSSFLRRLPRAPSLYPLSHATICHRRKPQPIHSGARSCTQVPPMRPGGVMHPGAGFVAMPPPGARFPQGYPQGGYVRTAPCLRAAPQRTPSALGVRPTAQRSFPLATWRAGRCLPAMLRVAVPSAAAPRRRCR